jgi:hypothetical protein
VVETQLELERLLRVEDEEYAERWKKMPDDSDEDEMVKVYSSHNLDEQLYARVLDDGALAETLKRSSTSVNLRETSGSAS